MADRLTASALRLFPIRQTGAACPGISPISAFGGIYSFAVNLLERRLDAPVRQIDELRDAARVTKIGSVHSIPMRGPCSRTPALHLNLAAGR